MDTLENNAIEKAIYAFMATTVTFREALEAHGYTVVPLTYIGSAGWTSAELWAYHCGIMYARDHDPQHVGTAGEPDREV